MVEVFDKYILFINGRQKIKFFFLHQVKLFQESVLLFLKPVELFLEFYQL